MKKSKNKLIVAIIVYILAVCNCEMPNILCNGDFESYTHFTTIKPFYYYQYMYRVTWFPRDRCWYAANGKFRNFIQVEQVFTNPGGIPIYSKAAEFNVGNALGSYWLCQNKIIQKRRYLNYTFQLALHPQAQQATAYAYINSKQVNRTTANSSVYPKLTTITHIFQTTQKKNSFCATIDNQIWRHNNYTQAGLASFLDNFQLRKFPQEVYTLNFQVKLNQLQSKIQLIADASGLNSTLIDYVCKNSIINMNGSVLEQVDFQIIQGRYLSATIKVNSFMVIYGIQYDIKAWLIGGDHQIAFDVFVTFIPPTKLFFPLKQSQLDTYASASNFGTSFFASIINIFNKSKIFGCSYLFTNLVSSLSAIILYNFLNLSAQPTRSYLAMEKMASPLLRNNEDIYQFMKNLISQINIKFSRDFGQLEGQGSYKTEKIPQKINGFYWFGSYGIYSNFLKNNIVDFILFAFLLIKVFAVLLLIKKIPYLASKLPKISNLQLYKLFIMQIISCSIFMIISAFSNISFEGQTNRNEKTNLILHVQLFGIILTIPIIYYLILRSELSKINPQLIKDKNVSKQEQKTKNEIKWEANFRILQFSCCFLIPVTVILQSTVGTFVAISVCLAILCAYLIKGWDHFSIHFKILKSLFLLVFTIHHIAYSYLGIVSIIIDNGGQITQAVGYWCSTAGMIVLFTAIALGVILLIQIVVFTFVVILIPLFGMVWRKFAHISIKYKSKNKVQNLNNKNIFDDQAQSRNPTIKYLNEPSKTPRRSNIQNQNNIRPKMGKSRRS